MLLEKGTQRVLPALWEITVPLLPPTLSRAMLVMISASQHTSLLMQCAGMAAIF